MDDDNAPPARDGADDSLSADLSTEIPARLRKLRRDANLRLRQVADGAGLSISGLSRLERGVRGVTLDKLDTWARVLGYRVEVVLVPLRDQDRPLSETERPILADLAAWLPHMPPPAQAALWGQVSMWRSWVQARGSAQLQRTGPEE